MHPICMSSILLFATGCVIRLPTRVHLEYSALPTPGHTKCRRIVTILFLVVGVPGRLLQSWPSTRIVHESFPLIRRSQMRRMWLLWRSGFMVSHNASSTANTFGPRGNRPWKFLRIGLLLPLPVLMPCDAYQYEACGSCGDLCIGASVSLSLCFVLLTCK